MDYSIKPGDHKRWGGFLPKLKQAARFIGVMIGMLVVALIVYPIWLVCFLPTACVIGFTDYARRRTSVGRRTALYKCYGFSGFIVGMALNVIFIPVMLLITALFLLVLIPTVTLSALTVIFKYLRGLCYETAENRR